MAYVMGLEIHQPTMILIWGHRDRYKIRKNKYEERHLGNIFFLVSFIKTREF